MLFDGQQFLSGSLVGSRVVREEFKITSSAASTRRYGGRWRAAAGWPTNRRPPGDEASGPASARTRRPKSKGW